MNAIEHAQPQSVLQILILAALGLNLPIPRCGGYAAIASSSKALDQSPAPKQFFFADSRDNVDEHNSAAAARVRS
jgi:hypothetical protein